jgi:hypothetical protein
MCRRGQNIQADVAGADDPFVVLNMLRLLDAADAVIIGMIYFLGKLDLFGIKCKIMVIIKVNKTVFAIAFIINNKYYK